MLVGLVLNKQTVEQIVGLYDEDYDRRAKVFPSDYLDHSRLTSQELAATGYHYPVRSHLTVDKLQRIMDWKYPRGRTRGYAQQNGPDQVESVTRGAFSQADPADAVGELCRLKGVWVAMASAILTVFDPLRFTVLDVRAWNALKTLKLLDELGLAEFDQHTDSPAAYRAYLKACVRLAEEAKVSLRSLDRCVWILDASRSVMNQAGLYGWARAGVTLAPIVSPTSSDIGP